MVRLAERLARERKQPGALAQLGEHLLCKQRVIGSIPIGSTIIIQDEKQKVCSFAPCEPRLPVLSTIVKKKTDLEGSSPKTRKGLPPTPGRCIRSKHGSVDEGFRLKGSSPFAGHNKPFVIDWCCLTAHHRGSSREAGLSPVGFSHPTGRMAPLQDVGSGCTPGRCLRCRTKNDL